MTRVILSAGAVIVGALVLAACGASGETRAVGTPPTKSAAQFRASVHSFEARLQASVEKFQSGNLSGAALSGGSLLANCTHFVDGTLAKQATTPAQLQSVGHLRIACSDMSKATNAGMSGSLTKAKELAHAALEQSQIAARVSG